MAMMKERSEEILEDYPHENVVAGIKFCRAAVVSTCLDPSTTIDDATYILIYSIGFER